MGTGVTPDPKHVNLSQKNLLVLNNAVCTPVVLTLNLSHNRLVSLPNCIENLSSLTVLDLSYNQLSELPAALGNLRTLLTLRLSHNQLSELPTQLGNLFELRSLDVSQNRLRSLPATLNRLPQLQTINVEGNPLYSRDEISAILAHIITHQNIPHIELPQVHSLLDLTARAIVRCNVPVTGRVPLQLLQLLSSVKTCTGCGGPYFGEPVRRFRVIRRNGTLIPLEHSLCSVHWNTDKDRIKFLFQPRPVTAPRIISN
jgi:Leucine-rich repeat (LRR) protein